MGVSPKNRRKTPKWMVKIMENPIKIRMICGIPIFLETPKWRILQKWAVVKNSYAIPFYLLVYDEIFFNGVSNNPWKRWVGFRAPIYPETTTCYFFIAQPASRGWVMAVNHPTNRKIHQTFSGTEKNRGIPSPTKAGCVDTAYVRETTPLEQPAVRYRKPSIFLVLALPETYMKSRPETSMVWKMIHVLKFWGKKGPIFGTSDLFFSGVYLWGWYRYLKYL